MLDFTSYAPHFKFGVKFYNYFVYVGNSTIAVPYIIKLSNYNDETKHFFFLKKKSERKWP